MSNYAVKQSIKYGALQKVGETVYTGKPPVYKDIGIRGVPYMVKIKAGVPFVKLRG